MSENYRYHSIDELRVLSIQELQALWEVVPTDRQRKYKQAYDRELRNAGAAASDVMEQHIATELIRRYEEAALVPVGTRWAKTPLRVQQAAQEGDGLESPDIQDAQTSGKPSPKILLAGGLVFLVAIVFVIAGVLGRGNSGGELEVTEEVSPTPTPLVSPTPTPLALEAQDEVIEGGDDSRAVAYPINLQIDNGDDTPRVWVVQRRVIQTSEWNYDLNPDTASFLYGMSVRPVIGIPWSEENAAWFEAMDAETDFSLQMNTGAVLRFEFAAKTEVRRSDTHIFRQVGPGLVLLLIGETDEDGLPTATRTLITATYPPEQELLRSGELLGLNASLQTGEVGDVLMLGEAVITLRGVATAVDAPDIPADQQMILIDFDVATGSESLDTTTWQVELLDEIGQLYTPVSANGNYAPLPNTIPVMASFSATVGYLVPRSFAGGRWLLTDLAGNSAAFRFRLETLTPLLEVHYNGIDVRVVSITHQPEQVTTLLRIYNGQSESLHITQDDIWLAFGYAPQPPGPRNPAEGLSPFDLLPEQAVDLTLVWYWGGEPYASLGVGEYRFAIQLTRGS
ncbi:MAG: hypothetical protein K8L97_08490 [Anaerolineae bacterium]|nr:hypothetical protein [Anaerolineae bacterium]